MSVSVFAALSTIEFWFGMAVGVAFDEVARRAIKKRVFGDDYTEE